jgi:hypothetical protein
MSTLIRITTLCVIVWCLVAQLYIIAIPLMLWYVLMLDGYELVWVSILVDGYYQAFYNIPVLSIGTLGVVVLVNVIKPYLMMYTGGNEMVS